MATIQCLSCGRTYASHFPRCIACNTPQPDFDGPGAAASAPPPPPPPPPLIQPPILPRAPAAPPKPECPLCGGTPGRGTIRMEKREFQGTSLSGSRRYEVRWVDIPGVCAGCLRSLELRRFAADVLCNVPFVVLFVLLVATDSKIFLVLLLTYALILFKWSWGLSYVWADLLLYGWNLDSRLARFEPPGDPGTLRFPSGWGHAVLRFGLLPGLAVGLLMLATVFGAFSKPSSDGKGGSSAAEKVKDPVEKARILLSSARSIAVPVDPVSQAIQPMPLNRQDMATYMVYMTPEQLPAGSSYQLLSGPQLLAAFLHYRGADVDMLFINGPESVSLLRWQAEKLAPTLPPPEAPLPPVLRRP